MGQKSTTLGNDYKHEDPPPPTNAREDVVVQVPDESGDATLRRRGPSAAVAADTTQAVAPMATEPAASEPAYEEPPPKLVIDIDAVAKDVFALRRSMRTIATSLCIDDVDACRVVDSYLACGVRPHVGTVLAVHVDQPLIKLLPHVSDRPINPMIIARQVYAFVEAGTMALLHAAVVRDQALARHMCDPDQYVTPFELFVRTWHPMIAMATRIHAIAIAAAAARLSAAAERTLSPNTVTPTTSTATVDPSPYPAVTTTTTTTATAETVDASSEEGPPKHLPLEHYARDVYVFDDMDALNDTTSSVVASTDNDAMCLMARTECLAQFLCELPQPETDSITAPHPDRSPRRWFYTSMTSFCAGVLVSMMRTELGLSPVPEYATDEDQYPDASPGSGATGEVIV